MKEALNLHRAKAGIKYAIYVVSVITACYGFWGCLFPDLTLVEGTYRFVAEEVYDDTEYDTVVDEKSGQIGGKIKPGKTGQYTKGICPGESDVDAEQLYADILDGKLKITFRSKFLELFKYKRGFEK